MAVLGTRELGAIKTDINLINQECRNLSKVYETFEYVESNLNSWINNGDVSSIKDQISQNLKNDISQFAARIEETRNIMNNIDRFVDEQLELAKKRIY